MATQFLILTLAISLTVLTLPIYAQITTPCTPSMISTFTPCMNFLTNSSLNGTSPPADCCNSLRSLMSSGKDCFCLMTTGSVPFNMPINRTLAISLPRACNMPSVPLQCKASGAPVPAPAPSPTAFGPTMSPKSAPSPTSEAPTSPEPLSPPLSPEADATPTPPSATTGPGAPTSNTGNRAGVTPSAAHPLFSASPLLLLAVLGVFALKYY
ncbi:non-specific lipid-transfer protein-like protein At2g13820 [Olea europaea var. sylvestris]|uniref:non-specific lipid-transfer protein-like protein At2g13820 n=1 Tax=Olea europaea var. sylvestris TaxID=158386 RepID=UPI000C1D374C|nr:non-specific lipid-transfer protein-like protein At2g13820 [Olea europaea var. sylvestris]